MVRLGLDTAKRLFTLAELAGYQAGPAAVPNAVVLVPVQQALLDLRAADYLLTGDGRDHADPQCREPFAGSGRGPDAGRQRLDAQRGHFVSPAACIT